MRALFRITSRQYQYHGSKLSSQPQTQRENQLRSLPRLFSICFVLMCFVFSVFSKFVPSEVTLTFKCKDRQYNRSSVAFENLWTFDFETCWLLIRKTITAYHWMHSARLFDRNTYQQREHMLWEESKLSNW